MTTATAFPNALEHDPPAGLFDYELCSRAIKGYGKRLADRLGVSSQEINRLLCRPSTSTNRHHPVTRVRRIVRALARMNREGAELIATAIWSDAQPVTQQRSASDLNRQLEKIHALVGELYATAFGGGTPAQVKARVSLKAMELLRLVLPLAQMEVMP